MKRQRRAIVTVPAELVTSRQWGVPVGMVPGALGAELRPAAKTFVGNYERAGETFIDSEDVHVYGPFASAHLLYPMLDPDSMTLTEEQAHQLWKETDTSKAAFCHFLFAANFINKRLPALAGASEGK